MKYIVRLSNEGDYLKVVSENSWRSTLNKAEATEFESANDAIEVIQELQINFFWNNVKVEGEK